MIRVLRSEEDLRRAREALDRRGLSFTDPRRTRLWRLMYALRFRTAAPLPDVMKSWDVACALEAIETHVPDRSLPILDMGCHNSEILWALHALGYRTLHGCDLNPLSRWMPYWHRIRYRTADLARTAYPDSSFAAVTCLSVVEHGVAVGALLAEVRRLLVPGGLFVLTTDFDGSGGSHSIDPGLRVFGQPWKIFDEEGLRALVRAFQDAGFALLDNEPEDLRHDERPVSWNGERYTFAAVVMRAPVI